MTCLLELSRRLEDILHNATIGYDCEDQETQNDCLREIIEICEKALEILR